MAPATAKVAGAVPYSATRGHRLHRCVRDARQLGHIDATRRRCAALRASPASPRDRPCGAHTRAGHRN